MIETPIINIRDIETLTDLYDKVAKIQEAMSDHIKTAQDRHGEEDVTVTRKDKDGERSLTVKQKVLWMELWHLGPGCPAEADLRNIHPEVFELKDKETSAIADAVAFEIKTFGFDRNNMTLPNVIKLIRGIVDFELRKR